MIEWIFSICINEHCSLQPSVSKYLLAWMTVLLQVCLTWSQFDNVVGEFDDDWEVGNFKDSDFIRDKE